MQISIVCPLTPTNFTFTDSGAVILFQFPLSQLKRSQQSISCLDYVIHSLQHSISWEKYKIFIKWKKFWLTVKHHSGSPLWKQIQNHPRQAPLSSLLHLYISIFIQTDRMLRNIHLRHFSVFFLSERRILTWLMSRNWIVWNWRSDLQSLLSIFNDIMMMRRML